MSLASILRMKLKYVLFLVITLTLTVEFCPYIISPVLYNKSFEQKQLREKLRGQYNQKEEGDVDNGKENPQDEYLGNHILHPYLGFINAPNKTYNRFCFPGPDPITQKTYDNINICLMGGSVAMNLYGTLKNKLIDNLHRSEFFKDKKVNVVLVALGGFKQPQQLMSLNYFLSLGAEYDIVINIDGFNDIVLPFSDNLPFNVFPSYPRHWNIYSRKKLDRKVQLILSRQTSLKNEQFILNRFFVENYLDNSNFGLLLWDVLNNKKRTFLFEIEEQLRQAMSQSESSYQSTGPTEAITDTSLFFMEQAELWRRASVLMGSLGKSAGFEYFHFLQPNQYYENSKKLTTEELRIAYEHEPFAYKTAVQIGYPLLVNQREYLKDQGINYFDLTLMFENEERAVYNDKCCHFNKLGNNMIAEKIMQYILNHFENNNTI